MLLTTLAAVGSAIAYLVVREPTYEAEATILVNPLPQDDQTFLGLGLLRESGDATRTTQTAAALLDSPEAAALTAETLGEPWTEKLVRNRIEVAPEGGSDIVVVTGQAEDAQSAADLATEFARSTLAVRERELARGIEETIARTEAELAPLDAADPNAAVLAGRLTQLRSIGETGDPTLTLQQAAIAPSSPSDPGPLIVLPLAILAGLALGSGAALIRELTDRRISDDDEATAIYPLSILAHVPELPSKALRGPEGASWFVPPEIQEAFLTLSLQLEQRGHPMKAVMITSPTRGDGKTNSAINFAVTLATMGKRVILLDFDLRNPRVGEALGLERAWSQAEILDPYRSLPQLLVRTDLPTLEVLPVRVGSGDAGASETVSRLLPQLIEQAQKLGDHVIVDTPPLGEVSDAMRIASFVDDILVVARPGNTEKVHLEALRDLLERIGQTPEGYIMIGDPERMDRGYGYGYGHAALMRTGLVVGGPGQPDEPAAPQASEQPQPQTVAGPAGPRPPE